MSPASLAVVYRMHPDGVRITALSAAITINLVALVFAMRPLPPPLAHVFDSAAPTHVRIIEPPKISLPPSDIVLKPRPKAASVTTPAHIPIVHEEHTASPIATTSPVDEPLQNSQPVAPPSTPPSPSLVPGIVSLAYRSAPLRFPTQALRSRMQGTVLLRVLVDEHGKPINVVIEHSSGYALLDQSAREQVLAGWRFQPALVDGRAVEAWARVPVQFTLQEY